VQDTYLDHVMLLGAKYAALFVNVQADAGISMSTGSHKHQYNVQTAIYPLENLNVYTITRGSLLIQNSSQ
jgi:hypothetical protein